ncbi:MAG: radical SAM protein [Gemmatimonadota bacterium]
MSTRSPDPIYLRASVANQCNQNCCYCPKKEGMENRVPAALAGQKLTSEEYVQNLEHIARNGIRGVSITGGEPTLNRDLPRIVEAAAGIFERVELTSNGFALLRMLPSLAPSLDLLKISVDTADPYVNASITNGKVTDLQRAMDCVTEACRLGLNVGINAVVMRSTLGGLDEVMTFARRTNELGHSGQAYVSLLDFYYSPERREIWEREFVPIGHLADDFEERFGARGIQDRFGCTFFWFDAEGVEVRFKDSLGATHRAPKCRRCPHYCQEGIYGLKHSVEGWVTSCPNGEPSLGALLAPGLRPEEADALLAPLIRDIADAVSDRTSFSQMVKTHGLHPDLTLDRTESTTTGLRVLP